MSNPRSRSGDVRNQIRRALYASLIDKIRQDKYPSTTMMDAVEAGIDDELLGEYADALLAKIESDQFPSLDLLNRISSLAR